MTQTTADSFPWKAWARWLDTVDFRGLDSRTIIDNALNNVSDVPTADRFEVAKATVEQYIDQGTEEF